jgi:hypothetical protein
MCYGFKVYDGIAEYSISFIATGGVTALVGSASTALIYQSKRPAQASVSLRSAVDYGHSLVSLNPQGPINCLLVQTEITAFHRDSNEESRRNHG